MLGAAGHRNQAQPTAASGATQAVQQVNVGGISGSNNTVNVQQQVVNVEELLRAVRTTVTDANAEIDAACGRMNSGDLDIAIHILEDLRRKRWDGLTPREKYRVEANIGQALERKGEYRQAAKHYMEAKNYQPLDENARAFEAIAYFQLDDKPKAYELAGDILKEHPNCSIAIAIRVRSSPPDVTLNELEAAVPPALGEELDILHALGWKALASGDPAAANRLVDIAVRRHPDSVEVKEQQAVVIVQVDGRAEHASSPVNTARLELAVVNLSAGILEHRGRRDEARLRYYRAEAYDLLGRPEEAETDFRAACDADKDEPDFVRRFVLFLKRHDRTDSAIDALRRADEVKKDHRNRLILCALLSDRTGKGDTELAVSVLQETLGEVPEPEIRTEMVALLTHLMGGQNRHDQALAYLDALDNTFLQPAVLHAIRARSLLRAGRKDESADSARRAAEALVADSSVTECMRVAESLRFAGLKQEALKLWKEILTPDHVDPYVLAALELARELGDDTFIMTFCKRLRAARAFSPFALELEVVTLEKYGIFDTSIEVINGYLAGTPEGELARVFRLRLSLLGIRLERPELIEGDPAKLPPVESAPVKIGVATAHVLRSGPHPERGIEYAYELVRRHFNDHTARRAYVGIVGLGDDGYLFPEAAVVAPGCAVKYRADDTGEENWLIVEDAADPRQERGEYAPVHIWVREMTGQSAGGKFHLRHDPLQSRTGTISGILNKYVYRKMEVLDSWEERFPGEDKLFVRKYTFPTNPDGSPDVSLLLKALDLKEQQKEEMHALYRVNPISAATFAMVADVGLLESLSHIASEGTLPIRCCLGNEDELARANASLSGAKKFVLDPSALATLFFSDQYEQLQVLAGRVVVCESALDEYLELRRRLTGPWRGFVGKFKGKYLFQHDDPDGRQRQERIIDKFLAKIRSLVELRPGESLAALPPDQRDDLSRLFGQATAEAMAEAAATGSVLWTDDLAVAEVGREQTGIARRVWTQLVFRSVAPQQAHTELTLFLIQWRYFFTRLEPDIVLAACRAGSWDTDAPALTQVAEWLCQPELVHEGAVRMCVLSLQVVWQEPQQSGKKQGVARLLLQALRRRKNGREAIRFIQNNLKAVFDRDRTARSECESVIRDMLQAEMGPADDASRAAWARVLPQVRRRLGLTGPEGARKGGQAKGDGSRPSKPSDQHNKRDQKQKRRKP